MPYQRENAIAYAHRWAYGRNPAYADFSAMGGDCTNFISQCLHAGGCPMNYTPVTGWFYASLRQRAPAWTGVEELYRFLTGSRGAGPKATEVTMAEVVPGDLVQLSFDGGNHFAHTPFIVAVGDDPSPDNILVATHSDDSDNRPLAHWWGYAVPRFLHIRLN